MKKILVSYAMVAAVVASSMAPAVFAETLSNTGNGVESTNNTTVNQNNTTSLSQSNSAAVSNNISVVSNTGDNSASRNTGGNTVVSTGDAGTKVKIENFANQNSATLDNCCNIGGNTTITNQGNGDSSSSNAILNKNNTNVLSQTNVAEVSNSVAVDSNSGRNTADRNTGGDVFVSTGDSLVGPISISTSANQNKAMVGSPTGAGVAGAGMLIGNGGNGVESDNNATVNVNNSQVASQFNAASVFNYAGIVSNSGDNSAGRNTGGAVFVDTGDSAIAVGLATQVNSNMAWMNGCGCVEVGGVTVKNLENGDSSDNDATVNKNNASAAYQANASEVANAGLFDTNTGRNMADRNTGSVMGLSDPSVTTGTAYTNAGASTAANSNTLNSGYVAVSPAPATGSTTGGNWWSWGYGYNGSMMMGY